MTYKRAALGALVALIAVLLSVSCLAQGLELSFQDTDFAEIFRALGETQGLNVLVDPAVQGKGTFQLKGVSFREAASAASTPGELPRLQASVPGPQ